MQASQRGFGKNASNTNEISKITHPHSPTNVQWSCGKHLGGEGRNGFDTFENVIHQQNGWRAFMMWRFSRLKFCISRLKIRKSKEKVQKNARFPFCGQTEAFRYEMIFRGIQPCFLHGGSERLACFEPTKAARFLKTLEVHSVLYDQRKVRFLKKNCCIYKGFMDVFYIFTSAWKKNHKMCIWNSLFYHVLDRFNLRERNDLTCLIIHSKYFPDSDWLKACV